LKHVDNFDSQGGSLLGGEYSNQDIKEFIEKNNIKHSFLKPKELTKKVAKLLNHGNVIGWFNGRMEFGPRALGSRSILGDARSKTMQSQMNLKIKYRESFRPFAPIVIKDKLFEWFDFGEYKIDDSFQSPYMLLVGNVTSSKKSNGENKTSVGLEKLKYIKSKIPAVTHVDGSARIQSVDQGTNRPIYNLLNDFYKLTGCPVLINTSFNVRGEPIVESPEDAYRCFMRTKMDYLVLGDFIISKNNQPNYIESKDWMKEFKLD
jgi:carbamoyltransferase